MFHSKTRSTFVHVRSIVEGNGSYVLEVNVRYYNSYDGYHIIVQSNRVRFDCPLVGGPGSEQLEPTAARELQSAA